MIMVPAAVKERKPTSFLDLPGELRNEIYKLAMPSGRKVDMKIKNLPWKLLGINVTGVRDQIGIEASAIFFRSNTFHANTYGEASRFLLSIDSERRGMIRRLELGFLAFDARVPGRRAPSLEKTMSMVNSLLGDRNGLGVKPAFVFITGKDEGRWVCVTEVPNLEIVTFGTGWEVRQKRTG